MNKKVQTKIHDNAHDSIKQDAFDKYNGEVVSNNLFDLKALLGAEMEEEFLDDLFND